MLKLTLLERAELTRRATQQQDRHAALRARVILLLASGATWNEVTFDAECSRAFVARWAGRFRASRLSGLTPRHRGRPATPLARSLERRIVAAGRERNSAGARVWTTRSLGAHLQLSHMAIHRIWARDAGAGRS